GWKARLVEVKELKRRWAKHTKGMKEPDNLQPRAVLYRSGFEGLLQGSLGRSEKYGDPVWALVRQRIPISLFFGLSSMILIYGICL
ncbi:MAG: ABC transporter permease, partial [Akkermansiaceae bacterium]|nr:ABC transporter permease [Akkermansiaceae bacterium]